MWLGGQTESFQNVGGGKMYTMYSLFKSLGGQELTYGGQMPPRPLNETMYSIKMLFFVEILPYEKYIYPLHKMSSWYILLSVFFVLITVVSFREQF